MMISERFEEIMLEYRKAKEDKSADPGLRELVTKELPQLFAENYPRIAPLIWKGSIGCGRLADVPWIVALDPRVTETVMEQYYPAYIFTSHLKSVYLSLQLGLAALKRKHGMTRALEIVEYRKKRLRDELNGKFARFDADIDLRPETPLSATYHPCNVFCRRYDQEHLNEEMLADDLKAMLGLYQQAVESIWKFGDS